MIRTLCCSFFMLALLIASGIAPAATTFTADITHLQEPGNIPDEGSSGVGTFVLNDDQTQLSYDVTLTGLDIDGLQTPGNPNDNVTRVHFHAAPPGSNGGIVYGIIDASPTLLNDNNPNDLVVNPVTGRMTGVWNAPEGNGTTLTAQLPTLLAGGLYFNVHTTDHAGGEIRGQVLPIPEPATAVLTALAAASVVVSRRRRA